jgi:flagellar assembly protein FliH
VTGPPSDQAYAEGFAAGQAEGIARAAERLEPIRAALGNLLAAMERELVTARLGSEANVVALALVVAKWLFQRAVEADPTITEGLVRRAVALLPAGVPMEIRAHPDDLEALGPHLDLREPDGRPLVVHWVGDPTLERGSFQVTSPERLVDGRADVALRSLYERLAGE